MKNRTKKITCVSCHQKVWKWKLPLNLQRLSLCEDCQKSQEFGRELIRAGNDKFFNLYNLQNLIEYFTEYKITIKEN
jgi:NAD-dependent SIR2 family protein deacetylase